MFKNRKDAGLQLAKALSSYQNRYPLVLAIPRGGVEIGYYVARELNCDLSLIIARKLGYPEHSEAAFGALAEDGSLFIHPQSYRFIHESDVQEVIKKEKKEIERRIRQYRRNQPMPSLENRVLIIVDDGIATGATLFAVIKLCQKHNPKLIVVAAPVSSQSMFNRLQSMVDDVVILERPTDFYAVSQVYDFFQNLDDQNVTSFLDKLPLSSQNQPRGSKIM